jgi:hypothetical protein
MRQQSTSNDWFFNRAGPNGVALVGDVVIG